MLVDISKNLLNALVHNIYFYFYECAVFVLNFTVRKHNDSRERASICIWYVIMH